MKILIIGGHLSPAISLIDLVKDKSDVLFVGRKFSMEGDKAVSLEYKICQEKGIKFEEISAGRLQRRFTRFTIFSLLKFPLGLYQAFKILGKFKPDVVVGFGGYVSLPVIFSAFVQRIPIVIHEQTLEAGLANRIASVFARKICISFERSRQFFPKNKTVLTGNPIRREIIDPGSKMQLPSDNLPLIYITGGSQGSVFLNSLVEKTLSSLLSNYRIIHQVGSFNNFEWLEKLKKIKKFLPNEKRSRYILSDHFKSEDVGQILRSSDLVVGRAGINTVTELLFLNKPTLLIPLPFSQRNEQSKNAQFLKDVGLAEILNEKGMSASDFSGAIAHMIKHKDQYKIKDERDYSKSDGAENILKVVENAAKKTD